MPVIAVFNQRAGVGKTTTALNLLAAIARRGQRPWGIDLDPQAHLSRTFDVHSSAAAESMDAFFRAATPLSDVAHITRSGVVVCPAHPALREVERTMGKGFPALTRLRRAVREPGAVTGPVVIDCPSTLGALTLNGVFAADLVLVPVCAEPDAVAAAGTVERSFQALERAIRDRIRRKYVLTRFDAAHVSSRAAEHALARCVRPEDMLGTCIRSAQELDRPPGEGRDVFRHAPHSRGARDYQDLLEDLLALGALA